MKVETPNRVFRDETGVPLISGTTIKVVEVIRSMKANSYGPDELADACQPLTREQVDAALSFYADHRQEIDDDIERRDREVEAILKDLETNGLASPIRD